MYVGNLIWPLISDTRQINTATWPSCWRCLFHKHYLHQFELLNYPSLTNTIYPPFIIRCLMQGVIVLGHLVLPLITTRRYPNVQPILQFLQIAPDCNCMCVQIFSFLTLGICSFKCSKEVDLQNSYTVNFAIDNTQPRVKKAASFFYFYRFPFGVCFYLQSMKQTIHLEDIREAILLILYSMKHLENH